MSTPPSLSQQLSPEAPRVGDYRRGSRLRTTRAGTWFPAVGPSDQTAGLLLVHPGVDLKALVPTIERLVELDLPGVYLPKPEVVQQAGRNWLVTDAPPVPTLADILDGGEHRGPGNAAALLTDIATTLLAVHAAELAHGSLDGRAVLVGPRGTALLADWGTSTTATAADDVRAWTDLAGLLAESWCADDQRAASALAEAADGARSGGLDAGINRLADLASAARRATLTEAAAAGLASLGAGGPAPSQLRKPKATPKAKAKRSGRTAQPTRRTSPPPDPAAAPQATNAEAPPDPEPPAAKPTTKPEPPPKPEPSTSKPTTKPEPPSKPEPAVSAAPSRSPDEPDPPAQPGPSPKPAHPDSPAQPEPSSHQAEPPTQAIPALAEPPTQAIPLPAEPATQAQAAPAEPPTQALPIPTEPATQAIPTQAAEAPRQSGTAPSGSPPPNTPPRPAPLPARPSRRNAPPTTPARTPTPIPRPTGTTGGRPRVPTDRPPALPGQPSARHGRPGTPGGRSRLPNDRATAPVERGRPHPASHAAPPPRPGPRRPTAGPSQQPDGPSAPPERRAPLNDNRKQRPRWRFLALCVLTVAAVLTAAVTLFLMFGQKPGPSAPRIESVTLWKHRAGTTCTLIGVITTNGGTGNVAYGWTSEAGSGPVVTEPVGKGREQVEARFDWHPETSRTPDPVVTLQVLQPELKQATAHPATDCG